ncbi:MAG TPA: hypothetical protein VFG07_00215 [Thermoplasmata archaeon]|nr:hypothetical protein [Thermoplasmata archaeon]
MAASTATPADATGLSRLALGAAVGFAGALLGVVLPVAFLYLSLFNPGGFFAFTAPFLRVLSILLLAGSLLLLVSFFLYRRAFAALRTVDRRFALASALCILGTLGFLLVFIAASVLFGSSDALIGCAQGRPTQGLHCLESGQPLGAYTALAGFLLGWLGGLGIVLGVFAAGSRYHRGALSAAGGLYALLLLVLAGPFLALLFPLPGVLYLLLLVPVLLVLAPGLAVAGSRPAFAARP